MTSRLHLILLSFATLLAGCGGTHSMPSAVSAGSVSLARRDQTTTPIVALDARSKGPLVGNDLYGVSLGTWYAFRRRFVAPSLRAVGIHLLRFPGGSESDAYHWKNGGSLCAGGGYIAPGATFDNFMRQVAAPMSSEVAITLDYGSNRACNAGGDPNEARAWIAHAKQRGYRVPYWTVGNEVYGSWEYDLHAHAHNPHTYARAVRHGYYPALKQTDSRAKLGIVVDMPNDHAWNDVVLREAQPFDFVELHYYPEYGRDGDEYLLGAGIDRLARALHELRNEMTAAGVSSDVPIFLGEFNNDSGQEGKQSVSIVNALFLGQMLGTLASAGVPMSAFWLGYGNCDQSGDFSKKLYGWQNFGSEALFSDGLPDPYEGCSNTPKIRGGTPFPTARVMALIAKGVPPGSSVRDVTLSKGPDRLVRAYGFAIRGGFALAMFNNTLDSVDVRARIENSGKSEFDATLETYGKAQYDKSKDNEWVGSVKTNLGRVGATVPLTLPPYSVSLLTMR